MQIRDISNYPDKLIDASEALMHDSKLLNIMITTVYSKSHCYNTLDVQKTFEIINNWLRFLSVNKKAFPTQFDYHFFMKGIKIVLIQDQVQNIAKVLSVIYNNFLLFPYEVRNVICDYLLGNIFFKLFMHWGKVIRSNFQCFLIFRVFHLHHINDDEI